MLRQKSGKPSFFRTCGRICMGHIRPTHTSMRVRLCSMFTFASTNIILQIANSVLCAQNAFPDPQNDRIVNITDNRNMKNGSQTLKCSSQTREIVKNGSQTQKCSSQTRKIVKNGSQTQKCSSQTREIVKNGSQTAKCSSQTRKAAEWLT